MLIGHYGPAFAIKAIDKKVPLWMLFIAVQIPDIIWGILILCGVEKANINPSLTFNPLDLEYMPYSHGLLSTITYSFIIVGLLMLLPRFKKNPSIACWIGLAIFSHWLLDFISHRPDLPVLYGFCFKLGLGLWNYPILATIIEVGIFLGGAIWYAIRVKGFKEWGNGLFWSYIIVSIVMSVIRGKVMDPTSIEVTIILALLYYTMATIIIYAVEKKEVEP